MLIGDTAALYVCLVYARRALQEHLLQYVSGSRDGPSGPGGCCGSPALH
jgi:hypothetical protein